MPTNLVNMDALIKRSDFEFGSEAQIRVGEFEKIQHSDLTLGSALFSVLRKPDFQRETAIWSPEKVKDLIVAFVEGDLVPAVILWRSPRNYNFIIDGAHRISSLIAWINDDYGTGDISRDFFGDGTPSWKKSAVKTKQLVEEAIGPYEKIIKAYKTQNTNEKEQDLLRKLANCTLRVQWLNTNDASIAERSFFKINEQGVPLSQTETILLYSRACPNAVSARAINQRGTGHKHWEKFGANSEKIEELSRGLHDSLFTPELKSNTVKTSDLPIGGASSQATSSSVLLDMVNLANGVQEFLPNSKEKAEEIIPPDMDGIATLVYLKATRRIITRVCNIAVTDEMPSLDLHPMVYFYSENGRHQPLAFLATVELMTEFEKNDSFKRFTRVRRKFEDFIVTHKDFVVLPSKTGQPT